MLITKTPSNHFVRLCGYRTTLSLDSVCVLSREDWKYMHRGCGLLKISRVLSTWLNKAIKMQKGRVLSWPAPPLDWDGHTDAIRCVGYSPNGQHIISGSSDMTIRLWDAGTGALAGGLLKGHTDHWVQCVSYSPDGQRILSGSMDMTLRIWDRCQNRYVLQLATLLRAILGVCSLLLTLLLQWTTDYLWVL